MTMNTHWRSIVTAGFLLMLVYGQSQGATTLRNQPPYTNTAFKVLNTEERLAYSDDWRLRTQRILPQKGHLFVILDMGESPCADLSSTVEGVTYFSFYPTPIDAPSYQGGATGIFYEALIPRNSVSCSLSPFVLAEWQPLKEGSVYFTAAKSTVEVQVRFQGHFVAPRRPLHIGLTNSFILKGHCVEYCRLEVPLGDAYRKLLEAHHLTPYYHWIRVPPIVDNRLDLDAYSGSGGSFRQQVMSGNDFWIAFPRSSDQKDPIAYLQALENTVIAEGLKGRAWVYVKDEPTDFQALDADLARYRVYAPSVLTMVTTPIKPNLMDTVDIFAPVIHQLINKNGDISPLYSQKRLWPYTSCMGSCGPDRRAAPQSIKKTPGPDTQLPDFLIDRPVASLQQFFALLQKTNAEASLYYHAVEGYVVHHQVNLFEDPWNFGGNGDGLLLYPGIPGTFGLTEHQPLPSFRLKLLRREMELQN